MKTPLSKLIPAILICCLGLTTLHAIKITIPDQYEDQVEAIKRAEQDRVARELDSIREGEAPQGANDGEMTFTTSGDNTDDIAEDVSEPLVQSIAEAANTAGAFEQNLPAGEGLVSGQIVDQETGQPIPGVAILIVENDSATVTNSEGRYTLGPAPAGEYTINFFKSGYLEGNVTDFAIVAGEVSVFPFALPLRWTRTLDRLQ